MTFGVRFSDRDKKVVSQIPAHGNFLLKVAVSI